PAGGGFVFNHLPGGWIKVPDGAIAVARVPHLAIVVDQQAMRLCSRRQVPLVKPLRVDIEARDLIPMHDRNIDIAIRARRRVAGELGRWHRPLAYLPLNLWPTSWGDAIVRPSSLGYPGYEQDEPNDNAWLYVWHGAIAPSPLCSRDVTDMGDSVLMTTVISL